MAKRKLAGKSVDQVQRCGQYHVDADVQDHLLIVEVDATDKKRKADDSDQRDRQGDVGTALSVHTFSPPALPNRPDGLTISTRIRMPKTMASRNVGAIYPDVRVSAM